MIKTLQFTVLGVPVPKQSLFVGRHGTFRPARLTTWQDIIGMEARVAIGYRVDNFPLECPIESVDITYYLPNKRRRDPDNISKGILDACNHIVWEDDFQIENLYLHKRIDRDNPRIEVEIKWITD